ncbi:MAG: hypothetical protein ACFFEN_14100 [Candidatus Thorarchaeota archaeon]
MSRFRKITIEVDESTLKKLLNDTKNTEALGFPNRTLARLLIVLKKRKLL